MNWVLGVVAVGTVLCAACVTPANTGAGASSAPQTADAPAASASAGGPRARVGGPVKLIDGDEAPNTGEPFEVEPGCHVLKTRTEMLVQTTEGVGRGTMPAVDIVIPMQAGHYYVVERKIETPSQSSSKVWIYAREVDQNNNTIRLYWPVDASSQLGGCRPNASEPREVSGISADH